jgi:hypothetical protein
MTTALNSSPIKDDVVTANRCWDCLAEGVAQRVVTVLGRPIVLVTLRCRLCGRQWRVEHEIANSL